MSKIPKKLKDELLADPFYKVCARKGLHGHECDGRITFEHALIYAGKQVQAKYAIIPLCAKAHSVDGWQDGGDLDKRISEWVALNRATSSELSSISKARNYAHYRDFLNGIYGEYPVYKPVDNMEIACVQSGDSVKFLENPITYSLFDFMLST